MRALIDGSSFGGAGPSATTEPKPGEIESALAEIVATSMGRSPSFPYPQRRLNDAFHTVFFDEGSGPPLVFVHGLGGNVTHFEYLLKELDLKDHRLLGLDLVGFGATDKPQVRYDFALLRDHLLSFLEERGIRDAVVIGHSMGGGIGLAAALQRPDRIRALVTIGGAGIAPLPGWMRLLAPFLLHEWPLYRLLLLTHNKILDQVFVDRPEQNPYVAHFRESALHDLPGFPNLHDFARVSTSLVRDLIRVDYAPRLAELQMPVLAIWGDTDKLIAVPGVREAIQRLPHHRLVILPRCGHLSMVERPKEVAEQIRRFLEDPP